MGELLKFKMNMRFYREQNQWSQEQLAEKIRVSRPVITRLETGEQEPTLSYLLSLSDVYGVSIDHLIGKDLKAEGYLYEVLGKYEFEVALSPIIDYLIKHPKLSSSLEQLAEAKVKDRKLIEDILITVIEKSTKLSG